MKPIAAVAGLIPVVVMALLPTQALAQGKIMYRCGSNYQDRPCDSAAPAAAKSGTATPAAGAATPQAVPAARGTTAAAPKATAAAAEAPKGPMTRAQQQQQIRCENYARQREELLERQKGIKGDSMAAQIKSLEGRMAADNCSAS